MPEGSGPPPHVHPFEDETFWVMEGEMTVEVGGKTLVLGPGSMSHIPRNTVHAFKVTSKEVCHALNSYTPAGFEWAILGCDALPPSGRCRRGAWTRTIHPRSCGFSTTTGSPRQTYLGPCRSSTVRSSLHIQTLVVVVNLAETPDHAAQASREEQHMNSVLFQPFRLHDLNLPNRIVLSPMTRGRAGAARLPNRVMAEYYTQRSSAGLLITEATTISEEANGWNESPGIYTDEMTEGWKHTTNAVHEKGGVIFLQLWHTGTGLPQQFPRRQTRRRSLGHQDQRAVHPHAHRQRSRTKSHGRWKRPRFHGSWRTTGEPPSERRKQGSTAWKSTGPTAI